MKYQAVIHICQHIDYFRISVNCMYIVFDASRHLEVLVCICRYNYQICIYSTVYNCKSTTFGVTPRFGGMKNLQIERFQYRYGKYRNKYIQLRRPYCLNPHLQFGFKQYNLSSCRYYCIFHIGTKMVQFADFLFPKKYPHYAFYGLCIWASGSLIMIFQ